MDSRLIFLRRLVDQWRDGVQITIRRLEMSVEKTELAGVKIPAEYKVFDRLFGGSCLKDVQEKLLGLKQVDRTKTDTGRRVE